MTERSVTMTNIAAVNTRKSNLVRFDIARYLKTEGVLAWMRQTPWKLLPLPPGVLQKSGKLYLTKTSLKESGFKSDVGCFP